MIQIKFTATFLLLAGLVLAAPKPDFIAYANVPWASCPLDIRLHWTDGNVTRIYKPYDPIYTKNNQLQHKEWYVGSVDCRADRVAYCRYVMVCRNGGQENSYKKVVVTDLAGSILREFGKDFGAGFNTECFNPKLSPDGTKVIFSYLVKGAGKQKSINSRLRIGDIATGTLMDVTPDIKDAWAWGASWSPCGTYIAFFHCPGPDKPIYLVAYELATGIIRKLANLEDPGWRTGWTRDGTSIILEYDRYDNYSRGAADASKVRLSTFNLLTHKLTHILDCTTNWSNSTLAGVLPDGRLMFRAIDPAIADRRYYSSEWAVVLNTPADKHYLMNPDGTETTNFESFSLSKDFDITPVEGNTGVAPDLSHFPTLDNRVQLPKWPDTEIMTSVRVENDLVHLEAYVPEGVVAESLWWEDSGGRFYNGDRITVKKEVFERAGGVFLHAVLQDGTMYDHFVSNSQGARPQKEPGSNNHQFTATASRSKGGISILINDSIALELRAIPAGSIVTHGVYHREKSGTYSSVSFLYDEGYANPRAMLKPHKIDVQPFCMGVFEVTQAQFKAVMGYEYCTFKGPNLPVEEVNGVQAEKFCKALSEKIGMAVRLPTLTEWKYAAKGGVDRRYYWGDTLSPDKCNYAGRWSPGLVLTKADWNSAEDMISKGCTMPVGSFPPNPYGLYDIYGNVAEMCRARKGEKVTRGKRVEWDLERSGPFSHGQDPKIRHAAMGGGWAHYGEMLDNHKWTSSLYGYRRDWNGFRIAVDMPKPE